MSDRTTVAERLELCKLIRVQAKVAHKAMEAREACVIAEGEKQLAAIYEAEDRMYRGVVEKAKKHIAAWDAEVEKISTAAGIQKQFRPQLKLGWVGRGENAYKERRNELRRVIESTAAANRKMADLEIDKAEARFLTAVMSDGLTSEAAQKLLTTMPTVETLMPQLSVGDLSKKVPLREEFRSGPDWSYRDEADGPE